MSGSEFESYCIALWSARKQHNDRAVRELDVICNNAFQKTLLPIYYNSRVILQ